MIKRILAIIGLIVIGAWIIATAVVAFLSFPGKTVLFPILIFGCILLPIMLWIILWAASAITGKKNVASFRNDEMDDTLKKAEEIKNEESKNEESKKESE